MQSQQQSKEFSLPKYKKSFYGSSYKIKRLTNTGRSTTISQVSTLAKKLSIACGGLKGAITSKRSQLVLIDDPIKSAASINNPDIGERWNKRGLTLSLQLCFKAQGVVSGRAFTLTIYTPRYLFQKITGNRLSESRHNRRGR